MNRVIILILFLFSSVAIVSCGSVGKRFDSSQVEKIEKGVTTKSQILEMFGLPFKEGVQDSKTTWTYQHDSYSAFGSGEYQDLVILFDNGVVKSYRFTTTAPEK